MTPRQSAYRDYLQTAHWQHLRQVVLSRDGFQCVRCPSKKHLQAHHRYYRQRFEDSEPDDLITLCRDCHKKEHGIKPRPNRHRKKKTGPAMKGDSNFLNQCEALKFGHKKISKDDRKRLAALASNSNLCTATWNHARKIQYS